MSDDSQFQTDMKNSIPNIVDETLEDFYRVYPDGSAIGGQIIGRGQYTIPHITNLDPETGAGKPGPEWTVGAQGVEVEYDINEYTYKIVRAISVIDAGKVLNQKTAEGQIMGAMSMGLAFGGRETFYFDNYRCTYTYNE